MLLRYVQEGNVYAVQRSLSRKVIDINQRDEHGRTALMKTSQLPVSKRVEAYRIAKMLLSSGCDVNTADNSGKNSLMHFAYRGKEYLIRLLFSLTDTVDLEAKDLFGNSALILAVLGGSIPVAKLLLHEMRDRSITTVDENLAGQNALSIAIQSGSLLLVQLLLNSGCKLRHNNDHILLNKLMSDNQTKSVKSRPSTTGGIERPVCSSSQLNAMISSNKITTLPKLDSLQLNENCNNNNHHHYYREDAVSSEAPALLCRLFHLYGIHTSNLYREGNKSVEMVTLDTPKPRSFSDRTPNSPSPRNQKRNRSMSVTGQTLSSAFGRMHRVKTLQKIVFPPSPESVSENGSLSERSPSAKRLSTPSRREQRRRSIGIRSA